ncbi:MAG TPA: PEGA domain-containing protein [Kofleriaceae bacterium]|nr:PEGA domain-containing protein [Kofleriaceae bacterium]
MLARRIIAVSPDKAFGKQLAVALRAAGGAVDLHAGLDDLGKGELQAALVVLHLDGELAGSASQIVGRLVGDTRLIAILPRSTLAAIVDVMQASERVAGLMVTEDFDATRLSAMATRVLAGDIFGLEKVVPWGTQIHAALVGDYQEKSLCIAQVSEFAELMGVRRKYRESIEQCLDEMLMNALYDAPVDEQGRQIFAEIPTKTRISLRLEQKAVVQYACNAKRFAISVRDAFGTLERATVLRYLDKCLHSEQQIDRKIGGAGLGLYLMTSSSSDVYFNVLPGVATEAVCTFDLDAAKQQLASFGFFTEKIDAAGRLAAGPSRRLPVGTSHPVERRAPAAVQTPRLIIGVLVAAIVATLALVAVAAWPRLFGGGAAKTDVAIASVPPGAAIEIDGKPVGTADGSLVVHDLEVGRAYPVVARLAGHEPKQAVVQPHAGANAVTLELAPLAASVALETIPSGATVELDGKALGTTPLAVSTLPPGETVSLTFKKPGYQDTTARLEVPKAGKDVRLVQPLVVAKDLARVRLTSEPAGAQVIQNGQLLAGVTTPAEVLVEAGKPVRFVLTMPNKVPAVLDPVTPLAGADLARSATLVDGKPLRVSTNLDGGKVTVAGAPHCLALPAPAECIVVPGSHRVELVIPGLAKIVKTVNVAAPVELKLELGFVEAASGKQLQLGGVAMQRAALEVGPHRITITDEAGPRQVTVIVKPGATVVAQ